jgi:hypothetical protein
MQLPASLPVDTVLVILYHHYLPNKAAALAALVLYAFISVAVTAVSVKTRSYYMLTVAVTGFLEVAGAQHCWQPPLMPCTHCGMPWLILHALYRINRFGHSGSNRDLLLLVCCWPQDGALAW